MLETAAGGLESVGFDVRPRADAGHALAGLGIYLLALPITMLCASLAGSPVHWSGGIAALAFGAAALVRSVGGDLAARRAPRVAGAVLAICGVISLVLLATVGLPVRPYGDGAVLAHFVADGRAMPRWLLGSTMAAVLHAATWELPSVQAWLPLRWQSTGAFLSLLGTATMVGGTWAIWRRWPGRLAVLLPVCTPVWVLFATGYVEYYPLIAPLFLAVLSWSFERPLGERSPEAIGAIAGLLPIVYLGFAPVAAGLLAVDIVRRRSQAGRTIAVALGVAAVGIAVCWPEGVVSYVRTLAAVINVGDAHLDPRYTGQVAGPSSMMFSWIAASSIAHMRDVWFQTVRGGGWWSMPLLALVLAWRVRESRGAWRQWRTDARLWLGVALTLWHVYYLMFMVPRLGPVADIDLFFPTYVLLPFLAGRLLDGVHDGRERWRTTAVLAVALAALVCTAPALVSGTLEGPR